MSDLSFDVELTWSGAGGDGAGEIRAGDRAIEFSGPDSMGGRGVGTNPEELLVCAVSSCYAATLFGLLRRRRLPVESLTVGASGVVTGFPGSAQFDRLVVRPTIFGVDLARRTEYEATTALAHDRCLIGRALAPEVTYEVGSVDLLDETAAHGEATTSPAARDTREHGRSPAEVSDAPALAWRSGE